MSRKQNAQPKRVWDGLTADEQGYGMAMDVTYRDGRREAAAGAHVARRARSRRATDGQPVDVQRVLAATRVGPVALVTLALSTSGFRTVAVRPGGDTLELWRDTTATSDGAARRKHNAWVNALREQVLDGAVDVQRLQRPRYAQRPATPPRPIPTVARVPREPIELPEPGEKWKPEHTPDWRAYDRHGQPRRPEVRESKRAIGWVLARAQQVGA